MNENLEIDSCEIASPIKRFLAALVDNVLTGCYVTVISLYFIYTKSDLALLYIFSIPLILYKPLMEFFFGATVGKALLSIKVVDKNGQTLNINKAYIRFIPFLLVTIIQLSQITVQLKSQNAASQEGSILEVFNKTQKSTAEELESIKVVDEVNLSHIFSTISFLMMMNLFLVYFNRNRQAGHDFLCGSFCIDLKTRKMQSTLPPEGQV